MSNVSLHPCLAEEIARHVNSRAVAASMVDVAVKAKPFDSEAFEYWKGEHMYATLALRALGVKLPTYSHEKRSK